MDKKTQLFDFIDRLAGITGCHVEAEAAKKAYGALNEATNVPEGILLNLYDPKVATDIGPNGAYNEALAMAEERFPYLDFPQSRENFQIAYGYDIDTMNMDSLSKRNEFSEFMKNLGEATGANAFCKAVVEAKATIDRNGTDWRSEYGSGGVITHENSASGFYATPRDSIGWAILNNDVEAIQKMHDGTIEPPEEPWNHTGWTQDENDEDQYRFDFMLAYEQEFEKDWERVVGTTDNQEALRLMLEYIPEFWLCDMDFYNAYLAGYDKALLAKLLRNFYALFDMTPSEELEWRSYHGYEGVSIEDMLEFLDDEPRTVTEAVDNMGAVLPDDKVYLSKDGTQVLTIHWSKQWDPSDDDYDEDGNEVENNLDCYTLGDLYDVQEGFDISKLPSDPYEVEQLEGKGVTLKANLAQLMRDSANLPSDEDVVDEYVGDPSYWTLVSGNTLVEAVGSDGRDVWSIYRDSYSTRLPFQEEKRPRNIAMTEKMIWCGKCGQRKRLSNDDLDNEVAGYYGEPLGYICKDCAKDMGIYDTDTEDED